MERMRIDWSSGIPDVKPAIERYQRYLGVKGLRPNTIKLYMQIARIYLTTIGYDQPSEKDAIKFCDGIEDCLSRSTRNNYSAALGHYHTMIGKPVKFPFVKVNNILPYFFDEYDVQKIFNAYKNIKHLAMLKILFFGCLRSSELANLNVQDYDSSGSTLRLRETKNGSDAIVYMSLIRIILMLLRYSIVKVSILVPDWIKVNLPLSNTSRKSQLKREKKDAAAELKQLQEQLDKKFSIKKQMDIYKYFASPYSIYCQ